MLDNIALLMSTKNHYANFGKVCKFGAMSCIFHVSGRNGRSVYSYVLHAWHYNGKRSGKSVQSPLQHIRNVQTLLLRYEYFSSGMA